MPFIAIHQHMLLSAMTLVLTLHLQLQDLAEDKKTSWMNTGYKLIAEVSFYHIFARQQGDLCCLQVA